MCLYYVAEGDVTNGDVATVTESLKDAEIKGTPTDNIFIPIFLI